MANRGLMIGGPMDGHMLTHDTERWDYHKSPESLGRPIDYSDMTATRAAMKAESKTGSYYFTNLTVLGYASPRRIGFWVEHDKTIDDALEALLTRYQEPRKEKNLLKRAGRIVYALLRSLGRPSETEFREARDVITEIERITDEAPH